jgi:hypothetical protein
MRNLDLLQFRLPPLWFLYSTQEPNRHEFMLYLGPYRQSNLSVTMLP